MKALSRLAHFRAWITVVALLVALPQARGDEQKLPKAAFFPLGGTADVKMREKIGLALRIKLDRQKTYEVIDGPTMIEATGETALSAATEAQVVKDLNKDLGADVLVWGEADAGADGTQIHLKTLDLRDKNPQPRTVDKLIHQPTDLRFVTEEILQTLPGVQAFEHPQEEAMVDDAPSRALWTKNPNLVVDGDFAQAGHWQGTYLSRKYPVEISPNLPDEDTVSIYPLPGGGNGLAMNLSLGCAQNNGLACISDAIKIEPGVRYRLGFRYQSDGPVLHVFVKGYSLLPGVTGHDEMREVYMRQVPPSGATGGKWQDVLCDLNPQHPAFPVQELRVDLYAYLNPGRVMFADVVLKAVGTQTFKAKDDAIKPPAP